VKRLREHVDFIAKVFQRLDHGRRPWEHYQRMVIGQHMEASPETTEEDLDKPFAPTAG